MFIIAYPIKIIKYTESGEENDISADVDLGYIYDTIIPAFSDYFLNKKTDEIEHNIFIQQSNEIYNDLDCDVDFYVADDDSLFLNFKFDFSPEELVFIEDDEMHEIIQLHEACEYEIDYSLKFILNFEYKFIIDSVQYNLVL